MLKANMMVLSLQVIKGNEFLDILSVLKVVVRNFFPLFRIFRIYPVCLPSACTSAGG